MGKYTSSATRRKPPKNTGPHYIWQGLGCIMIVLIAIISMAAGQLTVDYGIRSEAPIPSQMLGMPVLPRIIASSSGLSQMFGWITKIENFYAIAITSIVYMIVIGGFASLLYAIAYRFVAPPRYGPQDIPAPKFKRTKYKR